MALVVNTNVASITSQMYVNQTNKDMSDTMARLSSGKRINTAADDAAGVAIASRLEAGVRGTNQAIRNASDAQALIDTAEGAQQEMVNIMQRMRELAVQSANDSNSASDRLALNDEAIQLKAELERIAQTTTWAGQKLLDGSFVSKTFQIGSDFGQSISVSQSSMRPSDVGDFRIDTTAYTAAAASSATHTLTSTGFTVLGKDGSADADVTATASAKTLAAAVNTDTSSTGVKATAHTAIRFSLSGDPATTTTMSLNGGGTAVNISASVTDNADLTALLEAINTYSGTTGVTAEYDGSDKSKLILRELDGDHITISDFLSEDSAGTDLTATIEKQSDYAGTSFTTGVTLTSGGGTATDSTIATGVVRLSSSEAFTISGGTATTGYIGGTSTSAASTLSKVSDVSLSSRANAESAIGVLDTAIQRLNESRGSLGAVSNRLDSTVSNLGNVVINLEDGRSRIEDADFAQESANLAKQQIMLQAGTAMLAQANASQQNVLSLIS
jgi:flagellin